MVVPGAPGLFLPKNALLGDERAFLDGIKFQRETRHSPINFENAQMRTVEVEALVFYAPAARTDGRSAPLLRRTDRATQRSEQAFDAIV